MKHKFAFVPSHRKFSIPKYEHFSQHGKHTAKSLVKDLKVPDLLEVLNSAGKGMGQKALDYALFHTASQTHDQMLKYLKAQRMGKTTVGTLNNSFNDLINHGHDTVTFQHNSTASASSNKIDSRTYTTNFVYGRPTKRRIKNKAKTGQVVKRHKTVVDTESDYLSPLKRKQLTSCGGANQILYTFLLKDTFLTLQDYDKIYNINKKKYKDNLTNTYIHGDSLSDSLNLQIKSETDFYSMHIKVHLLALKTDITVEELIKNTFSEALNESLVQNSKIPIGKQYSCPKFSKTNKFKCEVLTALRTPLSTSDYWNENVKKVKVFSQWLGPNDKFIIRLTQRHGNGIFLNKIFCANHDEKLNDKPSNLFVLLEARGDGRASAVRLKDGANFDIVSPFRYTMRFSKNFSYLSNDDFHSEARQPTVSSFVKNDSDFQDEDLYNYFQSDREPRINIDYDKINVNRGVATKKTTSYSYSLRYDEPRLVQFIDPKLAELKQELLEKGLKDIADSLTEATLSDKLNFEGADQPDRDEDLVFEETNQKDLDADYNPGEDEFDPEDEAYRGLRGE